MESAHLSRAKRGDRNAFAPSRGCAIPPRARPPEVIRSQAGKKTQVLLIGHLRSSLLAAGGCSQPDG